MANLRGGSLVGGFPILGKSVSDNNIGKVIGNLIVNSLLSDDGIKVISTGEMFIKVTGVDKKVFREGNLLFSDISSVPTTLAGYGITDSAPLSHVGTGGAAHALATGSINGFLSAADFTKLAGVAASANNYVHPAAHPPSIITQDASNRFATDAEKTTWNAKAPTTLATGAINGLMAMADFTKLAGIAANANNYVLPAALAPSIITQDASNRFMTDAERTKLTGIATSANNYVHPAAHPPSIITQDASNRFMTDAERTTWNAKETVAGSQAKADQAELDAINFAKSFGVGSYVTNLVSPDLNTLLTSGSFYTSDATNAPMALDTYGIIIVNAASATFASQLYFSINFPERMHRRNLLNGVWTAWKQMETLDGSQAKLAEAKEYSVNSVSIGSAADPNTTTEPYILTNVNTHDNSVFWHIQTFFFNGKGQNRAQIAVSYNGAAPRLAVRHYYDPAWTSWRELAGNVLATGLIDGLMAKADFTKLAGIAASANNYVHPASHPPSMIVQDASNRFITDTERTTWNAKASTAIVTTTVDGLMAWEDFNKLTGIAASANNYVHPAAHPPSIITQDASNRFATDAEKNVWNAKAPTTAVTTTVNGLMLFADKVKLDGFTVVTTATANSVLKLDVNAKLPAGLAGNADTATKLITPRTITLTGDVTATGVAFDGSGNISLATVNKASGVVAGTYPKLTVNSAGVATAGAALVEADIPSLNWSKVSIGRPTTLAGYGITDSGKTSSVTATLPATLGWYRIATSPLGIDRNAGRFEVDWTLSGHHGQVNLMAGIMYSIAPTLDQLMYSNFSPTTGITQIRIVYHATYAGNYAYLEVYNAGANALVLTTQLASSLGWSLITPIAGSIPAGYTSTTMLCVDGIVTDGRLASQVPTGTAPLAVSSTTMVPNLNVEMVGGLNAASLVQTSRTVSVGAGLTGGGALSANITISPSWGGTGVATTIARSDHTHTIAGAQVTDVVVTAPTDGELLVYDTTTAKWINQTLAEALIQPAGSYLLTTGTAAAATKLITPRSITLSGDVTAAAVNFDGTANIVITTVIADDSHSHITSNIDGLDTALAGKASTALATGAVNGLMAMADFTKLAGIAASANNYVHPAAHAPSVITQDASNRFVTDTEKATWNAKQAAGSYLTTTGIAADSSKLGTFAASSYLRSDAADTGTSLTLTTNLITDSIIGRTSATLVNIASTASIDSTGTATRWRRSPRCYISQEDLGDVSIMVDEGGASTRGFKFEIEPTTYHKSVVFGQCNLKSLESSGSLQVRNITDTGYIPIVASAFTVVSQRELKKNIVPLVINAVDTIDSTSLYKYNYKTELDSEMTHIGLILDESPVEVVDPLGTGIDTYAMETLSWKAIQELSAKEKEQAKEIAELKEMVRILMDKVGV